MTHMSEGFESDNAHSMLHSVAYVAFQELATRISHRNTGKESGDPVCDRMLARIATDENLHMVFYRNLLGAGARTRARPDDAGHPPTVVVGFRMPGHGMPGFERPPPGSPSRYLQPADPPRRRADARLRHLKVLETPPWARGAQGAAGAGLLHG